MKLISTRPPFGEVSLRDAVLDDPSPTGGLYLPVSLPNFTPEELERFSGAPFPDLAEFLAQRIFGGVLEGETMTRIVRSAFDFPVPIVPFDEGSSILELFHGPTGSFKDFGARFLTRLLSVLRDPSGKPIVILVATSGDTGGAVADAVTGLPGVRAVVLYPKGRISPVQLRQIQEPATRGGSATEGVMAIEVEGSFDDCQRMVKEVLTNPGDGIEATLTSANSVNIGRLIPQSFYYVFGWLSLPPEVRERLTFSVPSGNIGNLTAGVLATRMGIPIRHFIAASNDNAAMTRFYATGEVPLGPSLHTLSSAMDVARPSNLERLFALFDKDMDRLKGEVSATYHGDDEVLGAMRTAANRSGYLLDPHTAVGVLGWQQRARNHPEEHGLILSTADPAKFPATVEMATGQTPPVRPDWDPEGIDEALRKGAETVVRMKPDTETLRALLRG